MVAAALRIAGTAAANTKKGKAILKYIKDRSIADAIQKYGARAVKMARGRNIPGKGGRGDGKNEVAVRKNDAKKGTGVAKRTVEGTVMPRTGVKPSTAGQRTGRTFNQEKPMFTENRRRSTTPPNPASGPKSASQQTKAAVAAAAATGATLVGTSNSPDKKPSSVSSYTIKRGDTLSAIAKRRGVRLSEIKAANPSIKDLNKIKPGQKIKIPTASIKGSGKSVYQGMSKAEMARIAMKKKKPVTGKK